jgi:ribosomal-protein-alanine N-acetyltransferase
MKPMKTRFPQIETDRLMLRLITLDDLNTMYSIWSDEDVMKYIPVARYRTRDDVKEFIPLAIQRWEERGFGMFSVTNKNNGEMLGYCGLQYLDETPEVEIYYGFSKKHWDKGVATEAARAVLRFGFEEAKLESISGITHPENGASQKVLENIGLKKHADNRTVYDHECAYFTATRDEYSPTAEVYSLKFI